MSLREAVTAGTAKDFELRLYDLVAVDFFMSALSGKNRESNSEHGNAYSAERCTDRAVPLKSVLDSSRLLHSHASLIKNYIQVPAQTRLSAF